MRHDNEMEPITLLQQMNNKGNTGTSTFKYILLYNSNIKGFCRIPIVCDICYKGVWSHICAWINSLKFKWAL